MQCGHLNNYLILTVTKQGEYPQPDHSSTSMPNIFPLCFNSHYQSTCRHYFILFNFSIAVQARSA